MIPVRSIGMGKLGQALPCCTPLQLEQQSQGFPIVCADPATCPPQPQGPAPAPAPAPTYDSGPWYCGVVPALLAPQWMVTACGIPDEAQADAQAKADIQKAAGYGTPSYNAQLAAQMYAEYQKDKAAYCADPANAANCAAYRQAQPGALGDTLKNIATDPSLWLLVAGAAVLTVMVMVLAKK